MKPLKLLLTLALCSLLATSFGQEHRDSVSMKKVDIKEVVVSSHSNNSHTPLSNNRLMESIPALMGEHDVVKYITTLPGVAATSILDPNFYVRGGSGYENRFLINGFPVASPQHISGILSLFDPYILGNSTLYKSGYPAQFSGALSSYVNMFTSSARTDDSWHGEASLGLVSSSLKSTIPVGDNGVLAVSARSSYLKTMLSVVNSFDRNIHVIPYSFSDFTASYSSRIGEDWSIKAFGLYSFDDLNINDIAFNWDSYTLNTSARRMGENYSLTIAAGLWGNSTNGEFQSFRTEPIGFSNQNARAQASTEVYLSTQTTLSAGLSGESTLYNYGQSAQAIRANTLNGYLSARHSTLWGATLEAGVNVEYYAGQSHSLSPLPRFKFNYNLGDKGSIWADAARTAQYTSNIAMLSLPSPVDVTLPLSEGESPTTCDQISLGAQHSLSPAISLYGALFYRQYNSSKEYSGASISQSISNLGAVRAESGHGAAKGAEVELKAELDKLSVRINYTFTDSWREFEKINSGKRFHPPYDITHNIMASVYTRLTPRITLSAIWQYSSGTYVTFPVGVAIANNVTTGQAVLLPIYDDIYNYKLPATHRLDVSGEYRHNNWSLNAGLYNAYNQANISYIDYKVVSFDTYKSSIEARGITVLPVIPYISLSYKW